MNIHALFPFGIRAGHDSIGADTLTTLTAGIHLDRRAARDIGWRGLRPSMSAGYAWTMRLAERRGIYALAFLGEERTPAGLSARFSMFHFPDPDEPLLAAYAPDGRRAAAMPDYFARIREFPRWEASGLFLLGLLRLHIRASLTGLAFSVEAPVRHRIVAVDGIAKDGVEPGGPACDIPAFRLAVPCLRLLALSASSLLGADPDWAVSRAAYPAPAFTARGEWGTLDGETLRGAVLSARFGDIPHPDPAGTGARRLSGRTFARAVPAVEDHRPILHIVSGFLGSGKTTFLSEWLSWLHNHDRHTAVLQNELGAKSLDAMLLAYETVSETLDEGCVCCTLADSLRPAIRRLMDKLPTEEIILETTGLANPGAVADALADLADMVKPGLRITLVDAPAIAPLLAENAAGNRSLAGEQIRGADVLVCNKIDGVAEDRLPGIINALQNMNPDATVFAASFGRIPFGALDAPRDPAGTGPRAAAPRPHLARSLTHQDEGYTSLTFAVTRPLGEEAIASLVRFAREKASRIKGIVDCAEKQRPVILQYASGTLALEQPLSPPGPDRFLVFIGKGFDAAFEASLARYCNVAPERRNPARPE